MLRCMVCVFKLYTVDPTSLVCATAGANRYDLFQCMYVPHTCTVWANNAHATGIFLCVSAFFFSLACTTLLTFVVCVVQLGEFQSH